MIQIIVNTRDISSQFNVTKTDIDNIVDFVVKDITASYARRWETEAKNNLHQTRQRYIENLKVIDTGRLTGAVVLDYSKDPLIKMIEDGAGAFDMKEFFAKSSKKKMKANGGWYLSIPFRFSTPGAIGDSTLFTGKMPEEIYDIAKNKPQNIPTAGGGMRSQGLKLNEIPSQFRAPSTRAGEEYKNKTSIYEGISKRKDSVTGQNTYMSFRRVSDESDINSWIHSGINANFLAEKALMSLESNMEDELGRSMDLALKTLGIE